MENNQLTEYADQYSILMELGSGGQARVYLGKKQFQLYALKIYEPLPKQIQACANEAKYLKKIQYRKHFIQMIDYRSKASVKLNNMPVTKMPMIVLEHAENGNLYNIIQKQGRFSPNVSRTYMKQILSAIQYMVIEDIAHRDLKPQNILFDREFTLKIADFGIATDARGEKGDYILKSGGGTIRYVPPERLTGDKTYTGVNVDLFAAGIILFMMMTGTVPFLSTQSNKGCYNYILTKQFDKFWKYQQSKIPHVQFSHEFTRLMNSFFTSEVNLRPTLEKLELDEWMNGPVVSQSQLFAYMQQKADAIAVDNPNIRKIMDIKISIQLQLAENNCKNLWKVNQQQQMEQRHQMIRERNLEIQDKIQYNQMSQKMKNINLNNEKDIIIIVDTEEKQCQKPSEKKQNANIQVDKKQKQGQEQGQQSRGKKQNANIQVDKKQKQGQEQGLESRGKKKNAMMIDQVMKEMEKRKKKVKLDERRKEELNYRGTRIDFKASQKEELLDSYRSINFNCQKLPQYTKHQVIYVNKDPGFVVIFLKQFLAQQLKDKDIFIKNFDSQVSPVDYNLQYFSLTHEIIVKLKFLIEETEETYLILRGKLHRSNKQQIGIAWCRVEGNSFWLHGVEKALNECLLALV